MGEPATCFLSRRLTTRQREREKRVQKVVKLPHARARWQFDQLRSIIRGAHLGVDSTTATTATTTAAAINITFN